MKTISIAVLLFVAITFSAGEDDGRYRPDVYGGDSGRYRPENQGFYQPTTEGRFSLAQRNGKYGSIYSAHRPAAYLKALNTELLAPFVKYGDGVDNTPYASTLTSVTNRPPVIPVSTFRPIVYSTVAPTIQPTYIRTQYNSDKAASIVQQENDIASNSYRYSYQTDNGLAAEEFGAVEPSVNGGGTRVRGFYQYVGSDGLTYRVDYTADENGFRPVGAHLPVLGAK